MHWLCTLIDRECDVMKKPGTNLIITTRIRLTEIYTYDSDDEKMDRYLAEIRDQYECRVRLGIFETTTQAYKQI